MTETHKIIPLCLGVTRKEVHPAAFYYKAYTGDLLDIAFGCFAVKSNKTGEYAFVDTGLAPQQWMKENNYPFAYEKIDGAPDLPDVMASKGIDPKEVKTIIFTHLHQDHCFYLDLFPNADLYVQKVEMQHAATPTPIEKHSYQKLGLPGTPFWARAWSQFIYVEGDKKIQDGIEVMFTPGHTPGSQTVIVQTDEGPYLITGDNYYTLEQFTEARMNGNFTDLEGWYRSRDRVEEYLTENNGKLLILHDPLTYEQEIYG